MTATAEPLTDPANPATARATSASASSAPGSPASAWRSACKQAAIDDFVVWERDADVGGTWWANTYPGCQCDVPSHLYSFSFALNPDWGRTYAPQPEIERYIKRRRRALRPAPAHRDRAARSPTRAGTRRATAGTSTTDGGRLHGRRRRRRARARSASRRSPTCPASTRSRARRSTPPTGTTTTTSPAAASRSSAPARARSRPCPRSSRGRVADGLPAHAAVGHAPQRPADHRRRAPRLHGRSRRSSAPSAAASTSAASCSSPASSYRPKLMGVAAEGRRRRHLEQARRRPRAARASSRPTTRSAASGSCRATAGTRRSRSRTSRSSRTASTTSAPTASSTADGELHQVDTIIFATGFHVTDIRIAASDHAAAAARTLDEEWDGSPRGLPRHGGARLPEPVLPRRPEHRPRPQLDHLHDRGPGRSTSWTRSRTCDARGASRVEVRPDASAPTTTHLQRKLATTVWNTGGCSSLVPRPQRAQRDDLARLHVPLLGPDAPLRPAGVRADRDRARPLARARPRARIAAGRLRPRVPVDFVYRIEQPHRTGHARARVPGDRGRRRPDRRHPDDLARPPSARSARSASRSATSTRPTASPRSSTRSTRCASSTTTTGRRTATSAARSRSSRASGSRPLQDLRDVYTPGVAQVCRAIMDDPAQANRYTWIGRTVAVCTNGTRVLGLGDIGPLAAMPVMEGKAIFYTAFTEPQRGPDPHRPRRTPTRSSATVLDIAPSFGAIHLEDIRRPGVLRDRGAPDRRRSTSRSCTTTSTARRSPRSPRSWPRARSSAAPLAEQTVGQIGLGAAGLRHRPPRPATPARRPCSRPTPTRSPRPTPTRTASRSPTSRPSWRAPTSSSRRPGRPGLIGSEMIREGQVDLRADEPGPRDRAAGRAARRGRVRRRRRGGQQRRSRSPASSSARSPAAPARSRPG